MSRSEVFDSRRWIHFVGAAVLVTALTLTLLAPAEAQRRRDNDEQQVEGRVLSTEVGEVVLQANEALATEQYQQVLNLLNPLVGTELQPYERSVVLRIRGGARFNLDNYAGAIQDFLGAINTGALVTDEIISLRTNIGQLYIVEERYDEGIQQFELAIRDGAELNASLAKLLAGAYVQAAAEAAPAQARRYYESGVRYAELFYRSEPNKTEADFNLMQFYYLELGRTTDELRVVRDALDAFPGSRRSWQNLVNIFARLGREEDAFEANKLMYLNGLFEEEQEIIRLTQYYSFFENPYRGASILEREMNAGRVAATERNLQSLQSMWRQAGEFDRAIPVLERVSTLIGDGETALRLAEAHYQRNNLPAAEAALETALNRGGLSNTGQAWELLGNIRYDQDDVSGALQAFRRATDFSSTRQSSNRWISFINTQAELARTRVCQRERVQVEECALTIDAERRSLVLIGDVNEDGTVNFPAGAIPQRCEAWFDLRSGEQSRPACISDAEYEELQAERAAAAASEEAAAAAGG
jgi:hypothetical protein